MPAHFSRPLNSNPLAHAFLVKVLGLPGDKDTGDKAMKVMHAESMLAKFENKPTLTAAEVRHSYYESDESRIYLRKQIFEELIRNQRLESDDIIELGKGGARPRSGDPRADKQAFIITGLPASGKSSVSNKIADAYGAYVVDSDYAKRKFPEFNFDFGASLVHDEATVVVFGGEGNYASEPSLFQFCISKGYNMVLPKIGYDARSIEKLRDPLIDYGYDVHLTLVSLDRVKAAKRALVRFEETNRYVPISLIFDGYSNNPILSYYRTKTSPKWKSYGKLSADVDPGQSPRHIESCDGNPAHLYREQ